jgi:hypothetical protein
VQDLVFLGDDSNIPLANIIVISDSPEPLPVPPPIERPLAVIARRRAEARAACQPYTRSIASDPHSSSPPSSESSLSAPTTDTANPDEDDHPGHGWIRYQAGLHRTKIDIPCSDEEPALILPAKYVRFNLEPYRGEPHIEGTNGKGLPVYAEELVAQPDRDPTLVPDNEDEYFAFLTETNMMDGALARAIDGLGDYGVWADIIRLRKAAMC